MAEFSLAEEKQVVVVVHVKVELNTSIWVIEVFVLLQFESSCGLVPFVDHDSFYFLFILDQLSANC